MEPSGEKLGRGVHALEGAFGAPAPYIFLLLACHERSFALAQAPNHDVITYPAKPGTNGAWTENSYTTARINLSSFTLYRFRCFVTVMEGVLLQ